MANLPSNLAVVEQRSPGVNPYNPSGYVSARAIAANTAESITIPTSAAYVRIATTADIYVAYNGTAAIVPIDADDGSSNELIKMNCDAEWRSVKGLGSISVITTATTAIVTMSFYTL